MHILSMEGSDSCIIVGSRRSLPKVFITSESESDSSSLRHRYSSGSSSVGSSSGTPNTPPSSTSTPHSKASLLPRFGNPGCMTAGYGSFQPSSYTDAYVPPLSLERERFISYQNNFLSQTKKADEVVRIDSGYGRGGDSSSDNFPRRNLNFSTSSSPSIWDSMVISPIKNFSQKLRGRPSFVDDGSTSKQLKINPQHVLACLISSLIIISIILTIFISYNNFNDKSNGKDSDQLLKLKSLSKISLEQESVEGIKEESTLENDPRLLMKYNLTFEEVEKTREEELKIAVLSQVLLDSEDSHGDIEVKMNSQLDKSVQDSLTNDGRVNEIESNEDDVLVSENESVKNHEQIHKSKKKKSRNLNPLTKSVRVVKKSKAKVPPAEVKSLHIDERENSLDYPDDPTFRKIKKKKRTKRDEVDQPSVLGDRFRKLKNDNDGGFRKKGNVEDRRD